MVRTSYDSRINFLVRANSLVNVPLALPQPPPRATTTTIPINTPTPRSTMTRRMAVRSTQIARIVIPRAGRFCVVVAVVVLPHLALYASSSISSNSSASPLPQLNTFQLFLRASRRSSIDCVRSKVDSRSCMAVSDICICCSV